MTPYAEIAALSGKLKNIQDAGKEMKRYIEIK